MRILSLVAVLIYVCIVPVAVAQNYEPAAATPGTPGDCWNKRMNPALSYNLRAITYGNGLWVAVGYGGAMFRSADGKTWTEAAHLYWDNMNAVTWTGTHFIAVGRVGTSFVSTDGIKWSPNSTSVGYDLNAILWTGSKVIAVGNSGVVLISNDGLSWSTATTSPPSTFNSYCIASNGTRLVCGGNGAYYSDDGGLSWSSASSPPSGTLKGIAWNGTSWCAAGDKSGTWWLTSPDANVWTETEIINSQSPQALIINDAQVLIATKSGIGGNGGSILYSSNAGASWADMAQPFLAYPLAIAKNGEKWVAVGFSGITMTSSDGVVWENRYISGYGSWRNRLGTMPTNQLGVNLPTSAAMVSCLMENHSTSLFTKGQGSVPDQVAWNGTKYAAVGSKSVFLSNDGIEWTNSTPNFFQFLPTGICWNGSQWVIVATFGKAFTSSDGLNWTQHPFPMTYPRKAISVGSQVVAIGTSGQIASSLNGVDWTFVDLGNSDIKDIAWHDGRFVVVGAGGFSATSTDGVNWSIIPSSVTDELAVVEWHNGRFIAIGRVYGRPILTTTDGSAWQSTTSTIGFTPMEAVSLDGSLIVINTQNQNWTVSRDGLSWSIGSLTIMPTLKRGAWNGRYFAATDTSGRYFISSDGRYWEEQEQGDQPGGGRMIADGNGFLGISGRGISRSPDSFRWSKTYDPGDSAPYMYGLASSGSTSVAVGDGGAIICSSNGAAWSPVTSGTTWPLRDVIWAGNRFVASGHGGTVLTSPDGLNWVQVATGRTGLIKNLTWTGSVFYAIEANNNLLSTTDFQSWNLSVIGSSVTVDSLIWTGDRLAGTTAIDSEAQLIESTDGSSWTFKPAGFYAPFRTLIWDGSQYLAVGSEGVFTSGSSNRGFDNWARNLQRTGLEFDEIDPSTGRPAGLLYAFQTTQGSSPFLSIDQGSSPNHAQLSFSAPKLSDSNITYWLESSTSLAPGSWNVIGLKAPGKTWAFPGQSVSISATESVETFTLSIDKSTNARAFYRLKVAQN